MPSIRQFLAASFFTCAALVAAAATTPAQTSNVQVVNPASNPVQTKIVNPASAPVQTKIVNTASSPVPVSGTVKIGNDAGTPVQTKIVNAAASPVFVRVVDESAHEPFQKTLSISPSSNANTYTVPTNKRLVIEFASAHLKVSESVKVTNVSLTTQISSSSAPFSHDLVAFFQGTNFGGFQQPQKTDEFTASQQVKIYAGPGTQVRFSFQTSVPPSLSLGSLTISGYLVPVPGAAATSAPVSEADAAEADWESQDK